MNSNNQTYAAIDVMPEGGGGARDEVGTFIIRACPTWGILANFEQRDGKFERCQDRRKRP